MKTNFILTGLFLLLVTSCSYDPQPASLRIQIKEMLLRMDGRPLSTLPELSWFKSRLGPAREIPGSINNLYIWDEQGLCIFQDSENGDINTLHISLTGDSRENRPHEAYKGSVQILGTTLIRKSLKDNLLESGNFTLSPVSGMLVAVSGDYMISLNFKQSAFLNSIEISRIP